MQLGAGYRHYSSFGAIDKNMQVVHNSPQRGLLLQPLVGDIQIAAPAEAPPESLVLGGFTRNNHFCDVDGEKGEPFDV